MRFVPSPQSTDPTALQRMHDALSSPIRREILWMLWDAELPAGGSGRDKAAVLLAAVTIGCAKPAAPPPVVEVPAPELPPEPPWPRPAGPC